MPIIITPDCDAGGVLHLPEALERFPDASITLYSRVSSYGQAGRGKARLEEKTDAVASAVRDIAPGKLRRIVQAIEEGKMVFPCRDALAEAAKDARQRKGILVAADLSRFIRAKKYSRTKNRNAWPTPEEFGRLHELTQGVPLATIESPLLTEDERHSRATRRTGKAGRPRAIDDDLAVRIWAEVEMIHWSDFGKVQWFPSLRELARAFRVSPATILRLLYSPSPTGKAWLDVFQEHGTEQTPTGSYVCPRRRISSVSKRTE
jgi:hypothetical protein